MKYKSLPAILAIVVLLLLTCFTVVFATDFYSAYGSQFGNSIYETTGGLPLYANKAMDAESVRFGIERAKALAAFTVIEAEDLITRHSMQNAIIPDDIRDDSGVTVPDDRDTKILYYVVYSESLTKSGGI